MAEDTSQDGAIHIRCVCGEELRMEPELLGRVLSCPHCKRFLRPALQFLLVEQEFAPNLTAVCTCGRFIIEKATSAGKTVTCRMCGQRVVLPMPMQRRDSAPVIRIPPQVLDKQLSRARGRQKRTEPPKAPGEKLRTASLSGRISLRPGQEVCTNPGCSLPMPPGANVCPRCGTNLKTGARCEAVGPAGDPVGKWKPV